LKTIGLWAYTNRRRLETTLNLLPQNTAFVEHALHDPTAHGNGVPDKSGPAFAAIRLWVDLNQDAQLDAGEQADLASLQIISINFTTGEVTYADGHSDALSATTLQSDTEGMRYTQMQEADAQGVLHTINAGEMLEHEGYQGQVQVVDQGGVRNSYYATNESSWKIAA
jgi:hypothetical protein